MRPMCLPNLYTFLLIFAVALGAPLAIATADVIPAAIASDTGTKGHSSYVVRDWPMLPGETLQQLAKLVYPDDVSMQRHLVAAMLSLNPEALQTIAPDTPFTQTIYIRLPDLRQLSSLATNHTQPSTADDHFVPQQRKLMRRAVLPPLHLAYQIATPEGLRENTLAAKFECTSCDELLNRNLLQKKELDDLARRLAELEAEVALLQETLSAKSPSVSNIHEKHIRTPVRRNWIEHWVELGVIGLALVVLGVLFWFYRRIGSLYFKSSSSPVVAVHQMTHAESTSITSTPDEGEKVATKMQNTLLPQTQSSGMSVDTIDSVVEEAKIYIALGRGEQAVELLAEYIQAHPHASVQPWLFLMEIYRSGNKRQEFSELAKHFHTIFNVMAPLWGNEPINMVVPTSLEEFPYIMDKLGSVWGTMECRDYLAGLISDNRSGERTGFSMEVLKDILLLLAVLELRDSV